MDFPNIAYSWAAASRIAETKPEYPEQRQRCPLIASRISASDGLALLHNKAAAAIIKPGAQKPHCMAWFPANAFCSRGSCSARPSSVVTTLPDTCTASMRQERTGWPSTNTLHVPQFPSPQEIDVLSPKPSRSRLTSVCVTGTVRLQTLPFSSNSIVRVCMIIELWQSARRTVQVLV